MSNALQQLMRERLDRQGWSYGEAARRGGIPRSTVHHLATTERLVRMPNPATLEGLARGLELPLDAIRRAAAEACGIHLYAAGPAAAVDAGTAAAVDAGTAAAVDAGTAAAVDAGTAAARAADPEVDVLIASLQQLSVDDRRHVAALVESLLDRKGRGDGPL
ncbi:helix-turn-helix domain-containing protein [Streptacidiphilus sp. EB129]|uniref:helix-turn-helix domain-containing protein n=1 Tax=Streptacidiphilus sp. EB129 TaxID=3156262 RepID=UPI003514D598